MKDRYNLNPFGHASRYGTRELHLLEIKEEGAIYEIIAKWDTGNNMPIRMGYDTVESGILDFIDFDGGPFVTPGFEVEPGVKVERIIHDGDFNNIRIIIK